jgi:hypothetical protein
MTSVIAQRIIASPDYSAEERRLARLWLRQRQLFRGDGRLMERLTESGRLTVSIGEVIAWRNGLSA